MIEKMNRLFEENFEPAVMNETAVIVNVGKVFTGSVVSIENTLKDAGVEIGESYWNEGLGAYVIPVVKV